MALPSWLIRNLGFDPNTGAPLNQGIVQTLTGSTFGTPAGNAPAPATIAAGQPGSAYNNTAALQAQAAAAAAAAARNAQVQAATQGTQNIAQQLLGGASNPTPPTSSPAMPLTGILDMISNQMLHPQGGAQLIPKNATPDQARQAYFLLNLASTPRQVQNQVEGNPLTANQITTGTLGQASKVYNPDDVALTTYALQNPNDTKNVADVVDQTAKALLDPKSEYNDLTGKTERMPSADSNLATQFGQLPNNEPANKVFSQAADQLNKSLYQPGSDPNAPLSAVAEQFKTAAQQDPGMARVNDFIQDYASKNPNAKVSDAIQVLNQKGQSPATYKDLVEAIKGQQSTQDQLNQQTKQYAIDRGHAIIGQLANNPNQNINDAVVAAELQTPTSDEVKNNFRLQQQVAQGQQSQRVQQLDQQNSFMNTVVNPTLKFAGNLVTGAGTSLGNLMGGNIASIDAGNQAQKLYQQADQLNQQSQNALNSGDKASAKKFSQQAQTLRAGADSYLQSQKDLHSNVGQNLAGGAGLLASVLGAKGLGSLASQLPEKASVAMEGIGGANQTALGALGNIGQATAKVAGTGAAANTALAALQNYSQGQPLTKNLIPAAAQGAALSLPFLPLGLHGEPFVDNVPRTNLLDTGGNMVRGEYNAPALMPPTPTLGDLFAHQPDREESILATTPQSSDKLAVPVGESYKPESSPDLKLRGDVLAQRAEGANPTILPFDVSQVKGLTDLNLSSLQHPQNAQQAAESYQGINNIITENTRIQQQDANRLLKDNEDSNIFRDAIRDPENSDKYAQEWASKKDGRNVADFNNLLASDKNLKNFGYYVDRMTGGTTGYLPNYHPEFYERQTPLGQPNETIVRTNPEQPFYSRTKKYANPAEAEADGFVRKDQSYQKDLGDWSNTVGTAVGGRVLSHGIQSFAPHEINDMMGGGQRLSGGVPLNIPGLRDTEVSQQIADKLKGITSKGSTNPIVRVPEMAAQGLKKALFYSTPAHALIETGRYGFNELASGKLPRLDQAFSDFVSPRFHNQYMKEARDSGLINRANQSNVTLSRSADVEGSGAMGNRQGASAVANYVHDATFGRLINYYKLETFRRLEDSGKIDLSTPSGIANARKLGNQVNSFFGGLNYASLNRERGVQQALRILFLAPDFNEGKVRTVSAALGRGDASGAFARRAVAAQTLGYAATATLANSLASGKFDPDLKKILSQIVDPRIQIGGMTLRPPGGTYGSDIAKIVTKPNQFVSGRLSGLVGGIDELLSRKTSLGEPLTVGSFLHGVLPIPVAAAVDAATKKISPLQAGLESIGIHASQDKSAQKLGKVSDRIGDINKAYNSVGEPNPQINLSDQQKNLLGKFIAQDGSLMTSGKPYQQIMASLSPDERDAAINAFKQLGIAGNIPQSAKDLYGIAKQLQDTGNLAGASQQLQEALKAMVEQKYSSAARTLYGQSQSEQEQTLKTLAGAGANWQDLRNQAENLRQELVNFGYPGAESKTIADQPSSTPTEAAQYSIDTAKDFALRGVPTYLKNFAEASAPVQQLALNQNPQLDPNIMPQTNAVQQMLINAGVKSPTTNAENLSPDNNLYPTGKKASRFGIDPNAVAQGTANLSTKGQSTGGGGRKGGGIRRAGGKKGRGISRGFGGGVRRGRVSIPKGAKGGGLPPSILGLPRINPSRLRPLDQTMQNLTQLQGGPLGFTKTGNDASNVAPMPPLIQRILNQKKQKTR